uniref:N-alpha-acetyltransferase 40 n=1 Tax=Coccolithus braarudii TaxID=221442 RepID=A0A7S0LR13_9EUKA|mmetsp:Transcript_52116/g.111479  ORF Transcript_52116/g.111479 Transcript_52116/m.111479 type:complete len:265 (+) Transcript_52116:107-901(+)
MSRNAVGPSSVPTLAKNQKGTSSRKKQARRDRLTRTKERAALVNAANAQHDLLSGHDTFRTYTCNDLDVRVEDSVGPALSETDIDECIALLRANMAELYKNSSWGWDEDEKRAGLVEPASRLVLLREQPQPSVSDAPDDDWVLVDHPEKLDAPPRARIVGFLHLQFVIENEKPVLYVLELQLMQEVREKGLGKFLMHFAEVIARQHGMEALMLTVFKSNKKAFDYYRQKLRYNIDASSPSKWNREADYEILSKPVDEQVSARSS